MLRAIKGAVLTDPVVDFLFTKCEDEEVSAFYDQLEKVVADPFGQSQPVSDPDISRYMLREFGFGGNVAYFALLHADGLVKVVLCQRR